MIWRVVGWLLAAVGGLLLLFAGAALTYNQFAHYESKLNAWPPPAEFTSPVAWAPRDPGKVRILALDGGGMFGLAWLEVLRDLEEQSGRPIAEMFDLVAGTSTGAIMGSLLLVPDGQGRPNYTVDDIAKIYIGVSRKIFDAPLYHQVLTLNGLLGPRFFNHGKFMESREVFRGRKFGDLLRPMMVPTHSRRESGLHVFHNLRQPDASLSLGPLVAAASSVPGAFPPVHLVGNDEYGGIYDDAGFILNDPASWAFQYALDRDPKSEIVVVSIGPTAKHRRPTQIPVNAGLIGWLTPIFRMVLKGQAELSTSSLATLERHGTIVKLKSFRLAIPLSHVSPFDASQANVDRIEKEGRDYVAANQALLARVVESLVPRGGPETSRLP